MKKTIALLLALCMIFGLTACGGTGSGTTETSAAAGTTGAQSQQTGTAQAGGTLNVGMNSAPVSENIWYQNDLNSATIMNLVCPNLVNVAMLGSATPMYTPISPVYTEFVASDIRQPAFDTAAAAQLLEEAGYTDTDGDGVRESASGEPLRFNLSYKSTLANVDGIMSILKSGTAEAGIELVLQPMDAATFSATVTQGHTYDISYSSWGTIDDVDTTLLTCFGIGQTLNFMEFNSQEQEDLLQAMQSETDYDARVDLLNQWQTWFVEDLPTLHLFVPNNTYVANTTNFDGWSTAPGNSAYLACANFVSVYAK